MSTIIAFPTAIDRATRKLEAALASFDMDAPAAEREAAIAAILEVATGAAGEARARAVRWLREVMNVTLKA